MKRRPPNMSAHEKWPPDDVGSFKELPTETACGGTGHFLKDAGGGKNLKELDRPTQRKKKWLKSADKGRIGFGTVSQS